jgi:hypothetical protein
MLKLIIWCVVLAGAGFAAYVDYHVRGELFPTNFYCFAGAGERVRHTQQHTDWLRDQTNPHGNYTSVTVCHHTSLVEGWDLPWVAEQFDRICLATESGDDRKYRRKVTQ